MIFRMSDARSKSDLRAAALAARDALNGEDRAAAAHAIGLRGLSIGIEPGAVVAGYSPIRSEIDPAPLMRSLPRRARGLRCLRHGRGQVAEISPLVSGRPVACPDRSAFSSRPRRGRNHPRHRAGAAGGVRPGRSPHRLWRRAL